MTTVLRFGLENDSSRGTARDPLKLSNCSLCGFAVSNLGCATEKFLSNRSSTRLLLSSSLLAKAPYYNETYYSSSLRSIRIHIPDIVEELLSQMAAAGL